MLPAMRVRPAARATSMPRWIEWIQAEHEKGTTMPVVPSTESPPSMPRRGFQVLAASSAPPGMEISTETSPGAPNSPASTATVSSIMRRGAGLMAGSPTASGRPARVTVPTPSPAAKRTPLPAGPGRTVATTSAPWVTSGSSPASFTIPALAWPSPRLCVARAKPGRWLLGRVISIGSGNCPVSSA